MDVQGLAEESTFEPTIEVGSDSTLSDTANRNRTALMQAYAALPVGDTEKWWSYFDPDVEFHEAPSLPYGQSTKGLEAAKQGMGDMFTAWKHINVRVEEFTAAGDLVIIYLHLTATSRKTGEVYAGPVAELFRFRNDKIIEWRPIYWDTHLVRKTCGV